MRIHHLLALVATAVAVVACGGGSSSTSPIAAPSSGPSTSLQSQNLTSPGSVTISSDNQSITLVGGDTTTAGGCPNAQYGFAAGSCFVSATFPNMAASSFDWTYSTKDTSGPGADIFGIIVDGKRIVLSDQGGAPTQSGKRDVPAAASVVFFVDCTDCTDGAATVNVTNFKAK